MEARALAASTVGRQEDALAGFVHIPDPLLNVKEDEKDHERQQQHPRKPDAKRHVTAQARQGCRCLAECPERARGASDNAAAIGGIVVSY